MYVRWEREREKDVTLLLCKGVDSTFPGEIEDMNFCQSEYFQNHKENRDKVEEAEKKIEGQTHQAFRAC